MKSKISIKKFIGSGQLRTLTTMKILRCVRPFRHAMFIYIHVKIIIPNSVSVKNITANDQQALDFM